jgi:MinD-like ATPase involved in chromosome partitioning or flagellar assembly
LQNKIRKYIKENLYDDNISVQRFGKMYVFNWSFTPQTAGTLTQQMSYQAMKIEQMANKIINYFSEVDKEKTKIID